MQLTGLPEVLSGNKEFCLSRASLSVSVLDCIKYKAFKSEKYEKSVIL